MSDDHSDITRDLNRWLDGDTQAAEKSVRSLLPQLLGTASILCRGSRRSAQLEPEDLLNEAILKFIRTSGYVNNRRHFLRLMTLHMKAHLVDRHRASSAAKRRPPPLAVLRASLPSTVHPPHGSELHLRQVLQLLQSEDGRAYTVCVLKASFGYTNIETSRLLGLSERTVAHAWARAREFILEKVDSLGDPK